MAQTSISPKRCSAVLRLAAQRLLRDERVGTDGAGVDFIGHQMAELHHVNVADTIFLVKRTGRSGRQSTGSSHVPAVPPASDSRGFPFP